MLQDVANILNSGNHCAKLGSYANVQKVKESMSHVKRVKKPLKGN